MPNPSQTQINSMFSQLALVNPVDFKQLALVYGFPPNTVADDLNTLATSCFANLPQTDYGANVTLPYSYYQRALMCLLLSRLQNTQQSVLNNAVESAVLLYFQSLGIRVSDYFPSFIGNTQYNNALTVYRTEITDQSGSTMDVDSICWGATPIENFSSMNLNADQMSGIMNAFVEIQTFIASNTIQPTVNHYLAITDSAGVLVKSIPNTYCNTYLPDLAQMFSSPTYGRQEFNAEFEKLRAEYAAQNLKMAYAYMNLLFMGFYSFARPLYDTTTAGISSGILQGPTSVTTCPLTVETESGKAVTNLLTMFSVCEADALNGRLLSPSTGVSLIPQTNTETQTNANTNQAENSSQSGAYVFVLLVSLSLLFFANRRFKRKRS